MKNYLTGVFAAITVSLTLFSNSVPAWAGAVSTFEVSIYDFANIRYAKGSMVSARYSAGGTQSIGCRILLYPNQPANTSCYARDGVGNYVACHSTDPSHVDELQGMTDSSYVYFITDLTTGGCNFIEIYDGSNLLK
jgi:hypothetical protein